jgi:hypothetical protein
MTAMCPSDRRSADRARASAKQASALTVLFAAAYLLLALCGASPASGDVGELGPPPAESEVRQALTDYFTAGHPLASTVDVRFDGPILVGQATEHSNPPLEPWCVRCGYPDQGISLMYPVKAVVTVKAIQDMHTSALAGAAENTATYNGTSCPGFTQSQFCSSFFFYRDGQGNWQVV